MVVKYNARMIIVYLVSCSITAQLSWRKGNEVYYCSPAGVVLEIVEAGLEVKKERCILDGMRQLYISM